MGWVGVITTAGESLIASYTTGNDFQVKGIIAGSGYDGTESSMRARTGLVQYEADGDVESVRPVVSSDVTAGTQFAMRVGPYDDGSYNLKEIGLIVTNNGVDTMVAYFSNSTATTIPDASTFPDFSYVLTGVLAINNGATFTLTVDPNANVSMSVFQETTQELQDDIDSRLTTNQGSGNAGKFMTVNSEGNIVPADIQMSGATSSTDGKGGLVPKPVAGKQSAFLRGDGQWQMPPDTVYVAGQGLSLNNNTFSLPTQTGVTTGSYGPSSDVTGDESVQVVIPRFTVDAMGRITAIANRTYTSKNTTYSSGTGLALNGTVFSLAPNGITAGTYGPSEDVTGEDGTTILVPQITVDAYGRVTGIVPRTYTSVNKNTEYTAGNGLSLSGTTFLMSGSYSGNFTATRVYNAVWNDYAECRDVETLEGGLCVREDSSGEMKITTERLMPGCRITSDTFGHCMGETDEARTPVAVSGRVLAYPTGDVSRYHLGDAVCSAPDGKIDVMTREEIREYPERIIGTVSEIPTYDVWYGGDKEYPIPVEVKGRIWVYVR